jgi:hypothetical protein
MKKILTQSFLVALLASILFSTTNCDLFKKEKKNNNALALAAIALSQRNSTARTPGVYISGKVVGANGTTAIGSQTLTIKGRGENAAIVKACTWTGGNKNACAITSPAGFYKDVLSLGTAPVPPVTQYGSVTTGAPTVANRDSDCGATVVAAFATSTVAVTGTDRVVCDGTTLDPGAVSAGVSSALIASGTVVGTIPLAADGTFTAVRLPNIATGNTYNVEVTGKTKTRRLRVAKSGTSTLLNNTCNGTNFPVTTDCANGNEASKIDLLLSGTPGSQSTSSEGLGDVPSTSTSAYDFNIVDLQVEVVYAKPIEIISGTIASNLTLSSGKDYLLSGTVIVPSGVTLTIPAGNRIFGAVSPAGALLVKQGGKLNAIGTATSPILFTSEKTSGNRTGGDWQGIILQGNGIQTFGGAGTTTIGEGDVGSFGGSNNADNSGTLKYVRIEFAGAPFSPGNERNCLSLMGIGSGTSLEYIQCHRGFDDGFEIWGGAVNGKYWVSTGNRDDQFDYADGWKGTLQFAIAQLYASPTAANDDTSRCIEGDGNTSQACDTAANCSDPSFANITCVGFTSGQNHGDAIFVRRSSNLKAGNFSHFLVQDFGALRSGACTSASATTIQHIYTNASAGNSACTPGAGGQIDIAGTTVVNKSETTPDFAPLAANTTTASADITTFVTGTTTATYYGAIQFGGTDWTKGWTAFPAN